MAKRLRAVAFDLDAPSVASLREAFPEWGIEVVNGASTGSLTQDWHPGAADLLVVGAGEHMAKTLGLCRGFRSQAGRALTPLLVLVPFGQEAFVTAALKAGADSCLVLPIHAKEVVSMLARTHESNQPGRHTLNLDPAQCEDAWRDDGGQG